MFTTTNKSKLARLIGISPTLFNMKLENINYNKFSLEELRSIEKALENELETFRKELLIYTEMEKKYCPEGHLWIEAKNTGLYLDYYFCPECNEIYTLSPVKRSKEEINRNFCSDRHTEMIQYAKNIQAIEKVTFEDLKKLGYLEL